MKTIIVTGTPGTGKTTIAKKLAKALDFVYIDVNDVIKSNDLCESYDKIKRCNVVDVDKLNNVLVDVIKVNNDKGVVIDSHLSHYLNKKYVDYCVVVKCLNLKELEKRLKKRKYIKSKIRENLDCEIFDVCLNEANENKHKIVVIDTADKVDIDDLVKRFK